MNTLYLVEGKDNQPTYGFGLECSSELAAREDAPKLFEEVSSLELIPESFFFGKRADFIRAVGKSQIPIIGHTVELSIGADEPLDRRHLDQTKEVLDQVNCVLFSDHLCMTRASGIEIGQLTTLPFTKSVVDVVCRKVEQIQKEIPQPFMIENITNRFLWPQNELEETEFINAVTRKAGCGLLLDVTNLYINSINHKFNPFRWLDRIHASSVMGIHLAGGIKEKGVLYDTHSRCVPKPVWDLLAYVMTKSQPQVIIIEWDQDMPSTDRLIQEARYGEKFIASLPRKNPRSRVPKYMPALATEASL